MSDKDDPAILKFGADSDATISDTIEFMKNRAGGLNINIDEPWAGDSESGFGRSCSFSMNNQQREKLRRWLNEKQP